MWGQQANPAGVGRVKAGSMKAALPTLAGGHWT